MRFGEYELRFRLVPTLLLALPIPLFIYLGLWQIDRAEQKRELAQVLAERSQMPPLAIQGLVADPSALRYRPVRVRGRLEPERQVFIENRRLGGRIGFHVVTPLHLEGSDVRVLVNRGWIPDEGRGIPPVAGAPEDTIEINGEVDIPSPPALVLRGGADAAVAWGSRWPYLTVDLFAAGASYPVEPFVILQAPGDPHGFQRSWPKELPKEGMHLGYAIQWFAFAVIAMGIYLRLSLSRSSGTGIRA